jgi:hypothetical protein
MKRRLLKDLSPARLVDVGGLDEIGISLTWILVERLAADDAAQWLVHQFSPGGVGRDARARTHHPRKQRYAAGATRCRASQMPACSGTASHGCRRRRARGAASLRATCCGLEQQQVGI